MINASIGSNEGFVDRAMSLIRCCGDVIWIDAYDYTNIDVCPMCHVCVVTWLVSPSQP